MVRAGNASRGSSAGAAWWAASREGARACLGFRGRSRWDQQEAAWHEQLVALTWLGGCGGTVPTAPSSDQW